MQAVPSGTNDDITLTRRHPLIGAEIRDIDLGHVDDEAFRRIYEAWLEHLLLVFPAQDVTDEEQIAFARRFGELEIHPSREHRSSRHPEIYRVSNVDERGNIMPGQQRLALHEPHLALAHRQLVSRGAEHGLDPARHRGASRGRRYAVREHVRGL